MSYAENILLREHYCASQDKTMYSQPWTADDATADYYIQWRDGDTWTDEFALCILEYYQGVDGWYWVDKYTGESDYVQD